MPILPHRIRFRKVLPEAVTPSYAKPGDSGLDLVGIRWRWARNEDWRTSTLVLGPGERALVDTGIAFETPDGYEVQIRPRSGLTLKSGLHVALGTVDSNFRGSLGVVVVGMQDLAEMPIVIKMGKTKVAQAVFHRVETVALEETDEISDTVRGDAGFGSTGVDLSHHESGVVVPGIDGLSLRHGAT